MSDSQLRKSLVRLAHQHPEFRGDLLPLLKQASGWAPLTPAGAQKVSQVFAAQFPTVESTYGVMAKKFGRKTVFCRDSGVLRLYCAGDDRKIYSMKLHNAFPPSDSDCYLLVDAASGVLDPLDIRKAGIYLNGNLSSSMRLAAEKGYTLRWLQGGFEVKGGSWDSEQEALAAAS